MGRQIKGAILMAATVCFDGYISKDDLQKRLHVYLTNYMII